MSILSISSGAAYGCCGNKFIGEEVILFGIYRIHWMNTLADLAWYSPADETILGGITEKFEGIRYALKMCKMPIAKMCLCAFTLRAALVSVTLPNALIVPRPC